MSHDDRNLFVHLQQHRQEHALRFWEHLSNAERNDLRAQLSAIDFSWLDNVLVEKSKSARSSTEIKPYRHIVEYTDPARALAQREGEMALCEGRLGVILFAGGQGTRLGFDGPKGLFPLGAVSGHTLFQIHVERVLAIGRRYGVCPSLYVMTSDATHAETERYFHEQNRFGLEKGDLVLFQQDSLPIVDEMGRLLLDAKGHVATSPNGNGGVFSALATCGALEAMQRRGVDFLTVINVDNPLAQSGDAVFLGYHMLRQAEFSCKAIRKHDASEAVGNFVEVDGKLEIVEYTELPREFAEERDSQNRLRFAWANPGLFLWSRTFVERMSLKRDWIYHRAHKRVPHLDENGNWVEPTHPCAFKFELFAMDALREAERSVLLECERDAEFAPVKNATGADSPERARAMMTRVYSSWIRDAGGVVSDDCDVEVSPLYALDATEFKQKLPKPIRVDRALFFSATGAIQSREDRR